jgi:hypothetical protein
MFYLIFFGNRTVHACPTRHPGLLRCFLFGQFSVEKILQNAPARLRSISRKCAGLLLSGLNRSARKYIRQAPVSICSINHT